MGGSEEAMVQKNVPKPQQGWSPNWQECCCERTCAPLFIRRSLTPQGGGIGCGLPEVRVGEAWRVGASQASHRLSGFIRRGGREIRASQSSLPPCEDTARGARLHASGQQAVTCHQICWHPDLGLPASRALRNNVCCLSLRAKILCFGSLS